MSYKDPPCARRRLAPVQGATRGCDNPGAPLRRPSDRPLCAAARDTLPAARRSVSAKGARGSGRASGPGARHRQSALRLRRQGARVKYGMARKRGRCGGACVARGTPCRSHHSRPSPSDAARARDCPRFSRARRHRGGPSCTPRSLCRALRVVRRARARGLERQPAGGARGGRCAAVPRECRPRRGAFHRYLEKRGQRDARFRNGDRAAPPAASSQGRGASPRRRRSRHRRRCCSRARRTKQRT